MKSKASVFRTEACLVMKNHHSPLVDSDSVYQSEIGIQAVFPLFGCFRIHSFLLSIYSVGDDVSFGAMGLELFGY